MGNTARRSSRRQSKRDRPAHAQHGGRANETEEQAAGLVEEAGQKNAEQPASGIGRIVEAYVLSRLFRASVRENEVGVERRVDRKRKAECDEARDDDEVGSHEAGCQKRSG